MHLVKLSLISMLAGLAHLDHKTGYCIAATTSSWCNATCVIDAATCDLANTPTMVVTWLYPSQSCQCPDTCCEANVSVKVTAPNGRRLDDCLSKSTTFLLHAIGCGADDHLDLEPARFDANES